MVGEELKEIPELVELHCTIKINKQIKLYSVAERHLKKQETIVET